jgi:hypothetical protein
MKRQRRKERKDHANQPGVTATGRGQETQEERIEGQSAKQNEKATIPEEIAAWGRPSPQRHAEYDGIQKLEKPNRQAVRLAAAGVCWAQNER